jgi:hypothetical protein
MSREACISSTHQQPPEHAVPDTLCCAQKGSSRRCKYAIPQAGVGSSCASFSVKHAFQVRQAACVCRQQQQRVQACSSPESLIPCASAPQGTLTPYLLYITTLQSLILAGNRFVQCA